jgi:hypothetical protein
MNVVITQLTIGSEIFMISFYTFTVPNLCTLPHTWLAQNLWQFIVYLTVDCIHMCVPLLRIVESFTDRGSFKASDLYSHCSRVTVSDPVPLPPSSGLLLPPSCVDFSSCTGLRISLRYFYICNVGMNVTTMLWLDGAVSTFSLFPTASVQHGIELVPAISGETAAGA